MKTWWRRRWRRCLWILDETKEYSFYECIRILKKLEKKISLNDFDLVKWKRQALAWLGKVFGRH